jgi:signal peptidase I
VPTGSAEKNILVGDRIWGNKTAYYFEEIQHGDFVIFDDPEFYYYPEGTFNRWWQKYVGFPLLGLPVGPDNWVKRVIAIPGDVIEGRIENGRTVVYRNGEKLDESSYVNPYPLIRLKKEVGFIDLESIGPFSVPSFLKKIIKTGYYTYDPSKSFAEQPYYNMTKEEVMTRSNGELDLRLAYSPTYENEAFNAFEELGIEVERRKSVDEFGPYTVPEGYYWVMGDSRKNSRDSRFWGFLNKELIHGRASFVIYSVDSEEALWFFELLKHPIAFWMKSLRWNRFLKRLK